MSDDDYDDDEMEKDSFSPSSWHGKSVAQLLQQPRGKPVPDSAELQRILALPRRAPVTEGSATAAAMVEMAMRKFAKNVPPGDCPCGCGLACRCAEHDKRVASGKRRCLRRLKWQQAWALYEMGVVGGLAASAPVGLGKCLDASTEVFDYATGRRRTLDEPGTLRVASFDKTLSPRDATAFPSGRKLCVDVRIADGTKLIASADHPILTTRGWVRAAELTAEDMVAVAVEFPDPEVHTQATDDEVKFLAYMLADGGCSQNQLHFTNANARVIEDWQRATRALGYEISERRSRSRAREFSVLKGRRRNVDGPGHYVAVRDEFRTRWNLHGLAKEKRAHATIWGLPRRQVALFLNRFWACDGHISKELLEITLASEKLIDDLRFLLLRLGVRSRKSYKRASYVKQGVRHHFDAWRLSVCGGSAERFLFEVGDVLGKELVCQTLREKLARTRRNTNHDVVPIGPREVHEMCDELGMLPARGGRGGQRTKIHRHLGATRGQYISRAKFRQFCLDYNYQGKYAHLATTDVAWERVVSVEDIAARDVYDLTVPETHNFVANGIVVHNTLLDVVSALAFRNVEVALLLIPSNLRKQITTDYKLISEHFRVPNFRVHMPGKVTWKSELQKNPDGTMAPTVHVVPYQFISDEANSTWIENLRPDLIILDEFDALADIESSRTMRFMRFMEEHYRTTRVAGWTGSPTDSSIGEMAHILMAALRTRSPMPTNVEVIEQFSRCLDAQKNPCPPGALLQFLAPGEDKSMVRQAYGRRLAETAGVIMIGGRQIIRTDAGDVIENDIREKIAPDIPERVLQALDLARNNLRPDSMISDDPDEILNDPLEQARVVRQIATGVFYRWNWNGIPRALALEWLARRRAWNAELREKMLRGEALLDSEKLCTEAARRAWGDAPRNRDLPEWRAANWPGWRDIKDQCKPTTEAEWLDEFLVRDAADWACSNRGILWYGMREFALKLGELTGLRVYGEGTGGEIEKITGEDAVIMSIKSHGRGTNGLQFLYDTQCVVNTLASARMYQQVLGRLCRDGQQSAVVSMEVYLHTRELRSTFKQALTRGAYVEDITSEEQMLLRGWRGYLAPPRDR